MRAGFELYRAFDQDAKDNREAQKLTIPMLALGGEISTTGPLMEEMAREVAEDVSAKILPGTAHWLPEENPEAFADAVLAFTAPGSSRAA
jgi:pimeloyl-ACP methyl ester carboxylesterase